MIAAETKKRDGSPVTLIALTIADIEELGQMSVLFLEHEERTICLIAAKDDETAKAHFDTELGRLEEAE